MKKLVSVLSLILLICCFSQFSYGADDVIAFPGAEGGGKYTKGARAASSPAVYHVTNLNASGSGSFKDAVSKSGRIIVFDVGGTINLSGTLTISASNLTILGQTAPGDGITLAGGDISLANGAEQIIMRHLRVRPTDKNGGEPDGIGGRWNHNIIIDHCSTSWGVDELLTLYAGSSENGKQGSNITVQNTIASESLRMSNHFKGAHGYGAIFGATNSTWHHNLLAHHDSRSPRLDRELQNTDVRNNVIYNWGTTNSAYGGEPYSYNNKTQNPSKVNWVNNYYKYGSGTKSSLRTRIFEISNAYPSVSKSQFYFDGNYVYGSSSVTSNNLNGVANIASAEILSAPVDMGEYEINTQTAEEAYQTVLNNVGATLPKRDAIDARIVNDVINQTGRIINNADEVGGHINTETAYRTFEIPKSWKDENAMGSAKETDIVPSGEFAGYTWIEAYVNDWTAQQSAPTNPSITVTAPAVQDMNSLGSTNRWAVINDSETLTYQATATAKEGTEITKFEIYDGTKLIHTENSATLNAPLTLTPGTHYLTSRAYNNKGEATSSPTSIVYVKSTAGAPGYTHAQIGSTAFNNQGGSWYENGVYTIMGSGAIGAAKTSDKFDFMYKEVTGDFDISVKVEQVPKFENGELCGIMIRETLDPKSRMAMISDGWLKYGQNVKTILRDTTGGKGTVKWFKNSSGTSIENNDSYDTSKSQYRVPDYLRMVRTGDTITCYVSDDGVSWTNNPRQPLTLTISGLSETLYVGLAVDSIQGTPVKEYMAEAKFSNLTITEYTPPSPTPLPTASPTPTPAPTNSPSPTPTPEPNYDIAFGDIENGSLSLRIGVAEYSSAGKSVIWRAEDNIPADAVPEVTNIFGDGKAVVPLNGTDDTDGTITFYDAVQWYSFVDEDGTDVANLHGTNNPRILPPITDSNQPTGNVMSFSTPNKGQLKLKFYIFGGKYFNLYDNASRAYIENNFYSSQADIYEFIVDCAEGGEYFAWAGGSKIGLVSAEFSNGAPAAKKGENIIITAMPDIGYVNTAVTVNTEDGGVVETVKEPDGSYSFTMPDEAVTISARFIPEGAPTPTAEPTPTPTTEPTPTAEPMPTPTIQPGIYYTKNPALEDGRVTATVMCSEASENAALIIGVYSSDKEVLESIIIEPIAPNKLNEISREVPLSDGQEIKVMLWNESMAPLSEVFALGR